MNWLDKIAGYGMQTPANCCGASVFNPEAIDFFNTANLGLMYMVVPTKDLTAIKEKLKPESVEPQSRYETHWEKLSGYQQAAAIYKKHQAKFRYVFLELEDHTLIMKEAYED